MAAVMYFKLVPAQEVFWTSLKRGGCVLNMIISAPIAQFFKAYHVLVGVNKRFIIAIVTNINVFSLCFITAQWSTRYHGCGPTCSSLLYFAIYIYREPITKNSGIQSEQCD